MVPILLKVLIGALLAYALTHKAPAGEDESCMVRHADGQCYYEQGKDKS